MTIGKFFGSILLIIGTSIGGGMLALPVATAGGGFFLSAIAFLGCWILMSGGAYLILEILQPLPIGSNMITLARHYLGKPGEWLIWLLYLALLYSLLGAYISGGTDVVHSLLNQLNIETKPSIVSTIYTFSFSLIIFSGIKWVDYVNRGLMFGKLGAYLLLVLVIAPFVQAKNFSHGRLSELLPHISILVTSFGFASIVPSLRDYWHNDIPNLKRIIFWGSSIPLLCYLIWNFVIMGAISPSSSFSLINLLQSDHAISGLGKGLGETTHNHMILNLFDFFSGICMLTAFLSVSLGLFDFLADGFKLQKSGAQGLITLGLTFMPPLAMVILHPGIYLSALNYAGILCIILLLVLPVFMTFVARNLYLNNAKLVPGKKYTLVFLLIAAIFCMVIPYLIT